MPKLSKKTVFETMQTEAGRLFSVKPLEKFSLQYIADSIKLFDTTKINIVNGSVSSIKKENDNELRASALIGSEKIGGFDNATQWGVPLENSRSALANAIWQTNDEAIKASYKRYMELKGGNIYKKRKEIDILSKERHAVDITGSEFENVDLDRIVDHLKGVTKELTKCEIVSDVDAEVKLENVERFFFCAESESFNKNSESTKIRTVEQFIKIRLTANAYDNEGEIGTTERMYVKRYSQVKFDELNQWRRSIIGILKEKKNCRIQETGVYPVLADGETVGVIMHEGIGHLLEAHRVQADDEGGTFRDKIGKIILPKFISVYSDPTIKNAYGSYGYDDEGIPAQRTCLIKNGMLMTYLYSRLTAGKEGILSNGSARADRAYNGSDMEYEGDGIPVPRMSNLVVESAKKYSLNNLKQHLIDLIKAQNAPYALYCRRLDHGSVSTDKGHNEIHPADTYRIYLDGHEERVRGVYIISTPYDLVNGIIACGGKQEHSFGYCGAESGMVPTTEIAPTAILRKVEFARENRRNKVEPMLPKPHVNGRL